jgi:hypothetical protein
VREVRSVKEEWKLILFGEAFLTARTGKGNVLLFPAGKVGQQKPRTRVRCGERLGGLLKYYSYVA